MRNPKFKKECNQNINKVKKKKFQIINKIYYINYNFIN